ncbi:MAG TPA: arylsulfotransferase family protein [Eudoraea sp.]|nr:arylsulfotransferase family protein [Eudoraea sp.]
MARSKLKVRYIIILVLGFILYTIALTGLSRAVFREPNNGIDLVGPFISGLVVETSDISRNIKKFFSNPLYLIANTSLQDGFTYHSKDIGSYPNLLITYKEGWFRSKIQLLDIATGKLIKEWVPDAKLISRRSYNESNPRVFDKGADLSFMHPLLLKDSSVVFQTGYSLVKINAASEVEWVNNKTPFHHSVEPDSAGNIYACGINFAGRTFNFLPDPSKMYPNSLHDDLIVKIDSETGNILDSRSVIDILQDNGYQSLIYANGYFIHDPIHLNDVQPAYRDSPYWKKGDLLVSCRNLSAVFLYRPGTNKIIWLKQGPWIAQHDPDFYGDNKLAVFGNDAVYDYSKTGILKEKSHLLSSNNEIYIYHFESDSVTTPYSQLLLNEKVKTVSQGRSNILPNGDIYIEETNQGRIIFGDSLHKKIEFARRIDPGHLSELKWSRLVY